MSRQRHKMCVLLTPQSLDTSIVCRHPDEADIEPLARLMRAAYQGTIDDEGETLEETIAEVQHTFAGAYGRFLPRASWLIEDAGRILSATIVTYFEQWQTPIITYFMTHPEAKGKGFGTELMRRSMNALLLRGYTQVCLAVTEGNTPAQDIFTRLGFAVVSSWESMHSRDRHTHAAGAQ